MSADREYPTGANLVDPKILARGVAKAKDVEAAIRRAADQRRTT